MLAAVTAVCHSWYQHSAPAHRCWEGETRSMRRTCCDKSIVRGSRGQCR